MLGIDILFYVLFEIVADEALIFVIIIFHEK